FAPGWPRRWLSRSWWRSRGPPGGESRRRGWRLRSRWWPRRSGGGGASMATAEKTLTIGNKLGLHARAAAKLVQAAVKFKSEVKIARIDSGQATEVNAKSIMGVLMLAAAKGTTVRIAAEGEDAEQAVGALTQLIQAKFGEE